MKKLPLCCYLMPWENWGFYWSSDLTLIPDWKSKIVNQSGLQTNLRKIDVIPQKGELFRKKASLNDFFSSELQFLFVTWPHVTTWTKGHVSSSLVTIGLVKVEIWKYNVLHSSRDHLTTWSNGHVTLLEVVPHLNSPACQVW